MSYGFDYWGRAKERENRAVDEKAYRRRPLADWDARWHALSTQARSTFLSEVKGPSKNQADHAPSYSVSASRIPAPVLDELTAAGFAAVLEPKTGASTRRVIAPGALYDFAARVRTLRRLHLLAAGPPGELVKYVNHVFFPEMLTRVILEVMRKAGIEDFQRLDLALDRYVSNFRWPGWVARTLKDPLADRILEAIQAAEKPLPLVELPGRIPGSDPEQVRAVVDKLIARLVLFEDLHPKTFEIMVGFLPDVNEGLIRAGRPRERPPLVVCDRPGEVGPDESLIANDLRALLLEVASEPPRMRQDGSLFQKEIERFRTAMEPLPAWLLELLRWSDEGRLSQALGWARTLELVKNVSDGTQARLQLASKGEKWLSSGLDEQYAKMYRLLNAAPSRHGMPMTYWRLFAAGPSLYDVGMSDDTGFLGESFTVVKLGKERYTSYWNVRPEDVQALRTSLDRAFAALEPGVFYRLESVVAHLAFGQDNPVNVGLAPEQVAVFHHSQPVPSLEEHREKAGRSLIEGFVKHRLIPLGGVQAAIDDAGKICIARERRLDAYFGREVPREELAPAPDVSARVVVQPDFSVIVIGLNPAAAAELAPFCERASGGGGRGAVIFKITRDSVVKAVSHGLKPSEIADRLRRHASHEVPANVLREVQDWSNWVRRVTPSTMTVLRCPDRDTADRVLSALRKQAERVNDTLIAVDQKKLTSAERAKLLAHGIIVEGHAADGGVRPKAKKRKTGRSW
jgi:Helicase conserved C-terminal domain